MIDSERQPDTRFLFQHPVHFLALGFGSGLSPIAPGTAGSLAALPLGWLLLGLPSVAPAIVVIAAAIVGIRICGKTADALGTHDHGSIVWDEFVGLWIALLLVPAGWAWWLLAFLLFRVFDIAKPWPIGALDKRVSGGLGIMLDDIVAGLFAGGSVWLLAALCGHFF